MKNLRSRISGWWCSWMHSDPMWPSRGQYQCRQCHRFYPVPWEAPEPEPKPALPVAVYSNVHWRSV